MTLQMIEQAQALTNVLNSAWDFASGDAINGRSDWTRANRLCELSRRAHERFNRRVWKIRTGR